MIEDGIDITFNFPELNYLLKLIELEQKEIAHDHIHIHQLAIWAVKRNKVSQYNQP